jgi:hypothetical protein
MDVDEAVALAKKRILQLFAEEKITDIGLEEVEYDEPGHTWKVTIGFSRPWDKPENTFAAIAQQVTYKKRSYKVVRIDAHTDEVKSIKNREFPPSEP